MPGSIRFYPGDSRRVCTGGLHVFPSCISIDVQLLYPGAPVLTLVYVGECSQSCARTASSVYRQRWL